MADAAPAAPAPKKGIVKLALGGGLGIATGAIGMYFNAAVNTIIKPAKPLANFVATGEGLTVTCENRASGQSGYWDFGDGSALEPFDPAAQVVKHSYAKPGSYSVKLMVRNFLMEENDRTVSVDLSTATATVATAPRVLDLKVEPIRDHVPATFHITGKLQNTDEVVWRLGDKTEQLVAPPEQIDRYVTFDTEGEKQIVLMALSHTHQDPQVVVQAVAVKKPTADTYEAMVLVTDTASRNSQRTHKVPVPAPLRDANGPTNGFRRTIAAGMHSVILKAEVDNSLPKVVKNLRVDVAEDQKSVTVSGEWTVTGDALAKVAGGSDLMIPLVLLEEHRSTMSPVQQVVSGVMGADQKITVNLPPRPRGTANGTRTVSVDFGASHREGKRKSYASGPLDATGHWQSKPFDLGGQMIVVQAAMLNDTVQLTFARAK